MATGPRFLLFGGRDWHQAKWRPIWDALDALHRKHPTFVLVHGDCPTGVDAIGDAWSQDRRIECHRFPAKWDAFGKAAGPMRNQNMLEMTEPAGAVGFPGGRGSADMRARLDAAGVKIWFPAGDTPL